MSKFIYKCVNCGKEYSSNKIRYTCSACITEDSGQLPPKGVLKVAYDYESLINAKKTAEQWYRDKYIDILPIHSLESLPPLRVGQTPMYHFKQLSESGKLFLKTTAKIPLTHLKTGHQPWFQLLPKRLE